VALAFGVQHVEQGATGVAGNVIGGAVLVGLYWLSGRNLWLPIIAHGVEDTSSLLLLYFGYQPPW
jgi:membrane protease YdiL (CAAX protease family)